MGESLVLDRFKDQLHVHAFHMVEECVEQPGKKKTLIVPDVDQFPGHIACSSLSKSEIVVPVMQDGVVKAVLDVDSDKLDCFETDAFLWKIGFTAQFLVRF